MAVFLYFVMRFQSTYLYKVRHSNWGVRRNAAGFQSTYLYKVRLAHGDFNAAAFSFNPRTYIRYDGEKMLFKVPYIVSIHVPI